MDFENEETLADSLFTDRLNDDQEELTTIPIRPETPKRFKAKAKPVQYKAKEPAWFSDPATGPQLKYLLALGHRSKGALTKKQACDLIGELKENRLAASTAMVREGQ